MTLSTTTGEGGDGIDNIREKQLDLLKTHILAMSYDRVFSLVFCGSWSNNRTKVN